MAPTPPPKTLTPTPPFLSRLSGASRAPSRWDLRRAGRGSAGGCTCATWRGPRRAAAPSRPRCASAPPLPCQTLRVRQAPSHVAAHQAAADPLSRPSPPPCPPSPSRRRRGPPRPLRWCPRQTRRWVREIRSARHEIHPARSPGGIRYLPMERHRSPIRCLPVERRCSSSHWLQRLQGSSCLHRKGRVRP